MSSFFVTTMEQESLESIQMKLALLFLAFMATFLAFSILLFFQQRLKPWCCTCHVCESYLNSSWRSEFENLSDWYAHLLKESPTQTVQVHVLNATITANSDNVEYMLKTNFNNFPKGKPFSSLLGDLLGRGIFNVDGDDWRFQRKMASLELGSVSVRSYAYSAICTEVRDRLLPILSSAADSGDTIDLQEVFRRFSFDTICKISFGFDPECLDISMPQSELAAALDQASLLSAKRALSVTPMVWKLKRLFNVGSERELKEAVAKINVLADEVIAQRRKLGFESSHDLLSRFMGSVDDDTYLRDIVVSFLLAGRDTVASGLTTFFYLMWRNPEALAKMREEIEEIDDSKISEIKSNYQQLEGLRSMQYVHAAVYESLRLYPPVQFDSKFCNEDDVLPDGTLLRKGTRVTYHPYAMGRLETVWGEGCGEYRPERWMDGEGRFQPVSLYRFPVFQGGARVCLGKELAILEMKHVAVQVVRGFDIEVVGGGARQLKFSPGLTASVSGGMEVRASRRRRQPQARDTGACIS